MTEGSRTDRLIAESKRLREELLRTATRLMAFAEELTEEARTLREAGEDDAGTGADGRPPGAAD